MTFFAQVIFDHPCFSIEPETWEWWLRMCWMITGTPDAVAAVASASLAIGAAAGLEWSQSL